LFIVGVFGLGSLLTMIGFHIGKFWAWFTTAMLSAALIGFEIIERLIIGQSFLQYIFGAIGIALIILVFFGETKAAQQNSKF